MNTNTVVQASRFSLPGSRSRSRFGSARGMSLVEATIILMVIATLTAVIAPSAGDYIEESRNTKAKEDVEVIGMGIARLLRDTGLTCVSLNGAGCAVAGKIEILVSGTSTTTGFATTDAVAFAPGAGFATSPINWSGTAAITGLMDNHLVTNTTLAGTLTSAYSAAAFTGGGGPRAALGWRGAYLNGPIDVDPWGYPYQANTVFAGVATNATAGTGEGALSGGWGSDMLVVSAGSNGNIQTPFASASTAGAVAVGDDLVYVIQGSTR